MAPRARASGPINASLVGAVEPLGNNFGPIDWTSESTAAKVGVFFTDLHGNAVTGASAAYYITGTVNGSDPNPAKGPVHELGPLTGSFTEFPFQLPSNSSQWLQVVGLIQLSDGSTVVCPPAWGAYFVTPSSD